MTKKCDCCGSSGGLEHDGKYHPVVLPIPFLGKIEIGKGYNQDGIPAYYIERLRTGKSWVLCGWRLTKSQSAGDYEAT